MVSILTSDGEIHESEESLRRKFQLYVDVAGDIVRGTGRLEEWLEFDPETLRGKNLTEIIEPDSLFLSSEIIFHAATGDRMKTCSVFLKGNNRSINGFMVRGEPAPDEDEYRLYFTQDPDMVFQGAGPNSAKGLADTVSHYLETEPDANLDMTFVDIGDVEALSEDPSLKASEIESFTQRVEDRLKQESISPDAVSRIENGKYGFVRESGTQLDTMEQDLQAITESVDPGGDRLNISTKTIELDADDLAAEDIHTAVQHAANEFAENGLDAIIFDTLADSQAAYLDKRKSRIDLLVQALDEDKLSVAYSSVVDTHQWKTDHLNAVFRADLDDDGLGGAEIMALTANDTELRMRVDEAQVKFIHDAQWQSGISVSVALQIHSLAKPEILGQLLEFAARAGNRHVVLRIEGLSPEILARIDAMEILRKAGFAVALLGKEVGALSDDSLKELPADYIIMDESFSSSVQALKNGLPVLIAMGERCRTYGKSMMFEGIAIGEIAQMLSKIPGVVASGTYFGRPITSFDELRYPMKQRVQA